MNKLAEIKARAERTANFKWQDAECSVEDFDVAYWIQWAEGLGYDVHPWGTGWGMGMPDRRGGKHKHTAVYARSEDGMWGVLRAGAHAKAKERMLVDYFAAHVPEQIKSFEMMLTARRLIAEHAANLPCIHAAMFVYDKKTSADSRKGIPTYYWHASDIEADVARSVEWRTTKLAELKARQQEWDYKASHGTAEEKAAITAALASLTKANGMNAAAATLAKRGQQTLKALKKGLGSLSIGRQPRVRNQALQHAA